MKEFCTLRAKAYAYLMDDDSEKKKAKGAKKCVIKCRVMCKSYADCLLNDKIILKSQQVFRSDHHSVYTVEINKIALSSNDHKRLQTFDRNTTFPHGKNEFKECDVQLKWDVYGYEVQRFSA